MDKKKNVSFLAVIFLVLGNCIGAGIFFKNATILNNTGSVVLSIVAWIIACFAIFCICMTLGEIVKKSGFENTTGYIGWVKTFCGTSLYKGFRNFMFWIYIPVVLFILPYYAVMSLQDALSVFFGNSVVLPWYVVILIATIFFIYFQYMGIVHKNTSLKQNFILTYMKFIPILFAIFGGIFYFALAGSQNTILAGDDTGPMRLSQLSPVFGVISAIPAIFFAFDGFYTATSAYENMKEPKKFSSALSIGIALTGALYMLISIGMLLGAKGGAITGWLNVLNTDAGKVLMFIILFCISLAVIGILNAFSMFSGQFYYHTIKNDNTYLHNLIKNKININDNKKFAWLVVIFILIVSVIFVVIGAFYSAGIHNTAYYGDISSKIYAFCDLIGDLTALITFLALGLIVLYSLIKKINTSKKYMFFAISGITIITISVLFTLANVTANLVFAIIYQTNNPNVSISKYLIPDICEFIIALVFLGVCFIPAIKDKIALKINR